MQEGNVFTGVCPSTVWRVGHPWYQCLYGGKLSGPMSFPGVGYLWSHVPSRGRVFRGGRVSDGVGIQGVYTTNPFPPEVKATSTVRILLECFLVIVVNGVEVLYLSLGDE